MPKAKVLFKLIFWKKITILKRQRADFNVIYFIWLAIVAFALYMRGLQISHDASGKEFNIFYTKEESADEVCSPKDDTNLVAYSPSSTVLRSILKEICPQARILSFTSLNELDEKVISDFGFTRRLLFAVSFNEDLKGLEDVQNLTTQLTIRLRMPSYHSKRKRHKEDWFPYLLYIDFLPGARNPDEDFDDSPSYQKRGFLYLQEKITLAFIKLFNKTRLDVTIFMQKFPYPKWSGDTFNGIWTETVCSFIIAWPFILKASLILSEITKNKELQITETLKIMGLPKWILWTSRFIYHFIILILLYVSVLVIATTVKINRLPIFPASNPLIVFLFLAICACATIALSFFVSTLFSTQESANLLGLILIYATLTPFVLEMDKLVQGEIVSPTSLPSECLFVGSAICYGVSAILRHELVGEGIQWDNWWNPAFPDDTLYFGTILCILILDTFLFLLLALYMDTIYPGKFGIRYSWYYPCTFSYWKYHWHCSTKSEAPTDNVEEENDVQKSVKIRSLTKKYGDKTVVDNLDLELYHDQITVLLGPNGSGKTTTISMISGMIQPTSGFIEIYGYNLHTNFREVKGLIGVCPQMDVLFEELTVAEHLYFFCVLKGVPKETVDAEVENYLKLLNLRNMRNILPKHLSVGMKRRLSIAMAICGNSKLIIFDEPTVGLDVLTKRTLWNLLQTVKKDKTILLITHFLDEAELLGDRIAVLSGGKIECSGTTLSLMQKFGSNYYLTMEVTSKCRPEKVLSFLQSFIPSVEMHSFIGTELVYRLPFSARAEFGDLFKEIEKKLKQLHIQGFGISPASLQEIFSRQASTFFLDLNKSKKRGSVSSAAQSRSQELYKEKSIEFMRSGAKLAKNQMWAVFMKKLLYVKQSWFLHLMTQLIIPVIILFTKLYPKFLYFSDKLSPLNISLDSYVDPVTFLGGKNSEYLRIYQAMLKDYNVEKVSNMSGEILSKTEESFMDLRLHYIVGASFESTRAIAWFNSIPLHSPPLALALVLNTVFKKHLGEEYSVEYVNDPLPLEAGESLHKSPVSFLPDTMVFVMLSIVISIIPNYIKERENGAKHLQFSAGLHPLVYWGVSFGFDFILFAISTSVAMGIAFFITSGEIAEAPEQIQILILTLFFYGVYQILWIYFWAFRINSPAAGVSYIFNFGMIIGLIGHYFLEELDDFAIIHYVYMVVIPFFPLFASLVNSHTIYKRRKNCLQIGSLKLACQEESLCCETDYFVMNDKAIGLFVTFCGVMSVVIAVYIVMTELSLIHKFFDSEQPPDFDITLEPAVRKEVSLIHNTDISRLKESYILLLKDLTKYYRGEHGGHGLLAVNGICLGVKPYECFGLLGSNGAGKTTTFKMITGDTPISFGDVWVNGFNVKTEMRKVHKTIGYCPQSNALFEQFTSYGILKYYGMIHGIATKMIGEIIEYYSETFHFSQHMKKKIAHLSEGNKRKLSTVIALLGNPKIILLDEPTSGVDPIVKREMWNVIAAMRSIGKSIVLTSHSMEDSEALCTRMAIMARGTFQCLGSKQELKNKFAEGYYVRVKMNANATSEDVKAVIDFVKLGFLGANVLEQCQQMLVFKLPDVSLPCSRLFTTFEKNKKRLNFDEFSIEMCNLEEVFLNFTKGISFVQSQGSSSSLTNHDAP